MVDLLAQLLAETGPARQRELVDANLASIDDDLMVALKTSAADLLRADVHAAIRLGELMLYAASATANPHHRALALIVIANARSLGGLGEYASALALYDEASEIYRRAGRPVDEANAQISKILVLANLGRYGEAIAAGERAAGVLEQHGEWLRLGKLTANLGNVHYRQGEDALALKMFDKARAIYHSLGDTGEALRAAARVENNRSTVLRNLGFFTEAIQASHLAHTLLERTGQWAEVARSEQNLAVTYIILGRYNDALALLGKAQGFFIADGRQRDAILVELFTCNCLLQLRRFADVLEKTREARDLFGRFGTGFEIAQALLNEATAFAGLERHDEALASLAEARATFEAEGNTMWVAFTDMESASVLHRLGRDAESLRLARAAIDVLASHGLPVDEAQARLVAARAAMALERFDEAAALVRAALAVGGRDDLPAILYPCHHLLGLLAERRADPQAALVELGRAIAELERLRRQLMIEHRVDFLEDKQAVYEDAVAMCLDLGLPAQGLAYAERAKSRALLELLDYRLSIGIQARSPADEPVVAELARLRAERDLMYRRWEGSREMGVRGWVSPAGGQREVQAEVLSIERRITALWHQLLVRNADYAGDALLWGAHPEPVGLSVPRDTLLLEYFIARDRVVVFLARGGEVRACRLSASPAEVRRLLALWQMNIEAAAGLGPGRLAPLLANARGLLQKLYAALLAPVEELAGGPLDRYARLTIVPSSWLHYLPFHAFHDGAAYLAARLEVSYLPCAGLLRHLAVPQAVGGRPLALGLSCEGRLVHAPEEARRIGTLLRGDVCLEEGATAGVIRDRGCQAPILHLATHGEFRPDNPLFSGLALADTWLTTLDIFGLRLQASLVTLSACQTGRNVVGGGDELLGLARAFLSAGATSLMLSLWAVEDRSTADFMGIFYDSLTQGQTKGASLRRAQSQFIVSADYQHPYFWAPFVLIGHTGPLAPVEGEGGPSCDAGPY